MNIKISGKAHIAAILAGFLSAGITADLYARQFGIEENRPKPGVSSFKAKIDNKEINCTELNDSTAVCDCDHEPTAKHAAACKIVLDANCSYHRNDGVWTCPIDPK